MVLRLKTRESRSSPGLQKGVREIRNSLLLAPIRHNARPAPARRALVRVGSEKFGLVSVQTREQSGLRSEDLASASTVSFTIAFPPHHAPSSRSGRSPHRFEPAKGFLMPVSGDEILVRTISTPTIRSNGLAWSYNSRSDHHSKVSCWGIVFDLLRNSPLMQQHAADEKITFGLNHQFTDFRTQKDKKLDLVICRPAMRAWKKGRKRYDLASFAHHCHRQCKTDPGGNMKLTHRIRWFLLSGGADAEGGGTDGIGGFEEAR